LRDFERKVEKHENWFRAREVINVMEYTCCKAVRQGKDIDEVPLLFESELESFLVRRSINLKGEANRWERILDAAGR